MKYKLPYPPTTKTPGNEGDYYFDTDSGVFYICKGCNTVEEIKDFVTMTLYPTPDSAEYIWEKQGGSILDEILTRSISGHFVDNTIEKVGRNGFYDCNELISVELQSALIIQPDAFSYCDKLISVKFPKATDAGSYAFEYSKSLTIADFSELSYMGEGCFSQCTNLQALILRGDVLPDEGGEGYSLSGTAIGSKNGYVYVPSTMIDTYKTEWIMSGDRYRVLEEYTVDGTVTGELDLNKAGITLP